MLNIFKLVYYALISGHPGGFTPGNPQAFAPRHSQIPPTLRANILPQKATTVPPTGSLLVWKDSQIVT